MKKIALAAAVLILATASLAQQYATWGRYKEITINTTGTGGGANVAGAVADFPVLVRLTGASLASGKDILDSALAGGADLRFSDSTGNVALPFEIESWSATAANVWVRVPSVRGNGGTKIRAYWKKAGAASASAGARVFNGFTGVWHLNEDGGGVGKVKDATSNALHFTGHDSVPAVAGAIGSARWYNKAGRGTEENFFADSIANSPRFQATGATTNFTISAWVNRQATNSSSQGIFGHFRFAAGDFRSYGLSMNGSSQVRVITDADGAASGERINATTTAFATTNTWMHLMVTYDQSAAGGTTSKVYVNGAAQAVSGSTAAGETATVFPALDSNARPLIGAQEKEGGLQKFLGYIDEVQFSLGTNSAVVRSADWAKLSFETQKPGATALTQGLTQAITAVAPTAIAYSLDSVVYRQGIAIVPNLVVVTGGADSFTVAPALPSNLQFDKLTGAITGTPTAVSAKASYVVTAYNSLGSIKDTLRIEVALGTPGAPTAVTGTRGLGQVVVAWTAPVSVGGSAITSYKAYAVQDTTKSCVTANGTTLTCTVTGLTNGTGYTFAVKAVNGFGAGAASNASAEVIPAGAPAAPTGVTAQRTAQGTVSVSWTAAVANGSAITSYKAYLSTDSTGKNCVTANGTTLTCSISGLTGNVSFFVRAFNALGGSAVSANSTPIPSPIHGAYAIKVSGAAKPFTFTLPADAAGSVKALTLTIHDMHGRTVWSKTVNPSKQGERELTWNGRSSNGRAVSAGMYLVKVGVDDGKTTTNLVEKAVEMR